MRYAPRAHLDGKRAHEEAVADDDALDREKVKRPGANTESVDVPLAPHAADRLLTA